MNNYADEIKSRVSMQDVIDTYVSIRARHNRIPCPVHGGDGYNFSYKDDAYHCFTCGAGGGVIDFVMALFNIDFKQAVFKLNYDFDLRLPIGQAPTKRQRQAMTEAKKKRDAEKAHKQAIINNAADAYYDALDELIRLERCIRTLTPHNRVESLDKGLVEAYGKIEYQKYIVSELMFDWIQIESEVKNNCNGNSDNNTGMDAR